MKCDSACTKKQPVFFMMFLKASVQQGQRVRFLLLGTAQKNRSVRSREFGRWGVGRYCIAGASAEERALVGARSSLCSQGEGNRTVVHCAQRRSPVSACAFCEQEGQPVARASSFVRFHVGSKEIVDSRLGARAVCLEPLWDPLIEPNQHSRCRGSPGLDLTRRR